MIPRAARAGPIAPPPRSRRRWRRRRGSSRWTR
uniref:Uncharacterized protein n=1 Tax=Arundo donax TaxID=35708 RepID=A0A0A9T0X1_ARUDO